LAQDLSAAGRRRDPSAPAAGPPGAPPLRAMAKDKYEKGKGKSKDDEKGGKSKGGKDKGDDKGGKDKWREEKGAGKGKGKDKDKDKDKEDKSKAANKGEDEDSYKERSQLSSNAPDFTPAMGYGMYGDGMQQWSDWPAVPAAPPLWREYKDEDGVPYFHNAKTGLCQWEVPPELEPPKPASAEKSEGNRDRRDPVIKRDPDRDERRRDRDRDDDGGGRSKGDGKGKRRGKDDKKGGGEPSEFGPPGCNLFVFHLPDDWTDDDLHEYFAPHGNVISAKVMKELGTGRSRGFGFVSYEDRVSSATAIKKMQGYKILGKRLKVEFKKGEQESNPMDTGDKMRDLDGDDEGKKSYPDDERLIGYLRAISAKNVVQSTEKDGDARSGDGDAAAAEAPEPSEGGD